MSLRDRLLLPFARPLFVLPRPVHAVLAGAPPPHAAGLEPDALLLARLAGWSGAPAARAAAAADHSARRRGAPAAGAPRGPPPPPPPPPPTVRATDVTLAGP